MGRKNRGAWKDCRHLMRSYRGLFGPYRLAGSTRGLIARQLGTRWIKGLQEMAVGG